MNNVQGLGFRASQIRGISLGVLMRRVLAFWALYPSPLFKETAKYSLIQMSCRCWRKFRLYSSCEFLCFLLEMVSPPLKPQRRPYSNSYPLKGGYAGFHISLGEGIMAQT